MVIRIGKLLHTTLLCIAFCMMANTGNSQQANDENAFFDGTYSKEYIRKNKIQTVSLESFIGTYRLSTHTYYFDRFGLLQKCIVTDTTNQEINRFLFFFDDRGNMSLQITVNLNGGPYDTVRFSKVYEGNKLVREQSTNMIVAMEHSYNTKGQRTKTENPYYGGYVSPTKRIVEFDYDTKGRVTHVTDRIVFVATDSTIQWMSDRNYNYLSKMHTQVLERIPNGEFTTNKGNHSYRFDRKGNLLAIETDVTMTRKFTYNNKSFLLTKLEVLPASFSDSPSTPMLSKYSYTFW